jgi:peptidoglycan/xylan/chitin deacetylase (PgdA/CDA1 family)
VSFLAVAAVIAPPLVFAVLCFIFAGLALLAADAFWPRVNLFGPAVVRASNRRISNAVALTFDDGPVSPYTAQILAILEHYGVKASFFCIGENVESHPELARAIVDRGHTIGSHTATHRNLLLAGTGEIRRELERGQESIRSATGKAPLFFRCPKGYKNPLVALEVRRLGLRLTGYSYPIWDVQNPPAEELVGRVLRRVRGGDIIVMHDGYPPARPGGRENLVLALPSIIEGILERGLTPVSLDQVASSP